jgi:hypothetical protein
MEYSDGITVTEEKIALWIARVVVPRGSEPRKPKDPTTGRAAKKKRKGKQTAPTALQMVLAIPEWQYVGEGSL